MWMCDVERSEEGCLEEVRDGDGRIWRRRLEDKVKGLCEKWSRKSSRDAEGGDQGHGKAGVDYSHRGPRCETGIKGREGRSCPRTSL